MSTEEITVLLIEDEARDARLIRAMLGVVSDVVFQVEDADRLSAALQRLDQGGIDVVLLDLSLPDSRGLATFTKIQKRAPSVPVVVMTGLDDEAVATEAVKQGAQDYLIKGQVDQGLLLRSLRYAIERHRSQQQLRESQAQYSMLVESARDAVGIIQDGVWRFVNHAAADLTGYSVTEMFGMPVSNTLSPESQDLVLGMHGGLIAGQSVPGLCEVVLRRKEGSTVDVEISSSRVQYLGKPAVMAVMRDITERKQAERAMSSRLELEETISRMSSRFLGMYSLDEAIEACLEDLGNFVGAIRVYLFLLTSDGKTASNTHEWCAEGIGSHKDDSADVPVDDLAWLMSRLGEGEPVIIDDVAKMPREARAERRLLERRGVVSVVFLPLRAGEELVGFMGLDNVLEREDWSTSYISLPLMTCQIIGNVLHRHKTEEERHQGDKWLRVLMENASDGIMVLDSDGKVQYQSPSVERVMGYRPEELEGKTLFDYVHPEDRQRVGESLRTAAAKTGATMTEIARIRHKKGSWRALEATSKNLLDDPLVQGVIVNFRDITDRRHADEMRERSEERFRILVENASEAISLLSPDGTIVYESPSNEHVLGHKAEDVLGTNIVEWTHVDDREKVLDLIASVAQEPEAVASDVFRCQHNDGSWRFIEAVANNLTDNNVIRGIVLNYRDITERKEAEEALRGSEERFRTLIENASDAITIFNADGTVQYVSPSIKHIMGYDPEELKGKNIVELLHPDEVQAMVGKIAELASPSSGRPIAEWRFRHKDGSWHVVEGTGQNLLDDPRIRGLVANFRDITERKRAEEALRESEKKLKDLVERLKLSQEALSTPVVQLWENVLALPLIGVMDEHRAQHVMEVLLSNIVNTQSELVILDVTGVASMDTQIASYISQTVKSASMLGARCVLTGIQPEVAQTVVGLGLDMDTIVIRKDMRDGLRWALDAMGYQLRNGHKPL